MYISHYAKMKRFAEEYVLLEKDVKNIVHNVFLELWGKTEVIMANQAFLYENTKRAKEIFSLALFPFLG